MRRVRKLLGLAPEDRRLLLRAGLLVVMARLGLWLLPFHLLRRAKTIPLSPVGRGECGVRAAPSPERIAWAVSVASRYVPAASCLTQALAADALLARWGYSSQLRIGVAKGPAGQLEAHAWVESCGQVVVGGSIRERYTSLPNIEGLSS